jgi:Mg-chelatase subunit ChlD
MKRIVRSAALVIVVLLCSLSGSAQRALPTGESPARIILLVDSSSAMSPMLTHFRAGLQAFLDGVPAQHEIALISTGGQLRIRVPPTSDRDRLDKAVASFASEGGANAFLDSLLEADTRLLKSAPTMWPVFVIVMTDAGETRSEQRIDDYNKFMNDFTARGGQAHTIVIRGKNSGVVTDIAINLSENTRGIHETIAISNALPDKLREVATRLEADYLPHIPR